MRLICLDTETTGLDPLNGDRLVEVACVEITGRRITDDPARQYQQYVNPERDIPDEVRDKVTGITNEMLADKPLFSQIADSFIEFVQGAELIIHNAEFDVGFLDMELQRAGKKPLSAYCPVITDTLALARKLFPGLRNDLDTLCSRYEIDKSARTLHGALIDSQLLAEVYLAMTRTQGSLIGDRYDELADSVPPLPDPSLLIAAACPAEELQEHEKFIAMIDKKCKAGSVWTRATTPPAASIEQKD